MEGEVHDDEQVSARVTSPAAAGRRVVDVVKRPYVWGGTLVVVVVVVVGGVVLRGARPAPSEVGEGSGGEVGPVVDESSEVALVPGAIEYHMAGVACGGGVSFMMPVGYRVLLSEEQGMLVSTDNGMSLVVARGADPVEALMAKLSADGITYTRDGDWFSYVLPGDEVPDSVVSLVHEVGLLTVFYRDPVTDEAAHRLLDMVEASLTEGGCDA